AYAQKPRGAAFEAEDFPAGRDLPEAHGPVLAGRGQPGPVRAERQAVDPTALTSERVDLPAGRDLPEAHGPVLAGRGQAAPVRAKGHAPDPIGVAAEGEEFRMTKPLEIMPLPAALVGWAVFEQLVRPAHVVVPPRSVRKRNVVKVLKLFGLLPRSRLG